MTNEEKKKLTEKIERCIKEVINEKILISEMAIPLKDYRKKAEDLRFQLVENWCLCKYCQLYSHDNQNFAHWIVELKSIIQALKFVRLKGDASKEKALYNLYVDRCDYKDAKMIHNIIFDKFTRENITSNEEINNVSVAFTNGIDALIHNMADDETSLDGYIEETCY